MGDLRLPALGSARGKVILLGEHAVVYGHPALAAGLDRGVTVRLEAREGATRVVDAAVRDPRLLRAVRHVLPATGFAVRIRAGLPVGRGLGSSAALSVAMVRACAAARGEDLPPDETFRRSLEVERIFHGNPSGVDNTVAAEGGLVWFRRGEASEFVSSRTSFHVVLIDGGEGRDTARMVASVAAQRPGVDPLLAEVGDLARRARDLIEAPAGIDLASLGTLLDENHRLLVRVGVSTERLDALADLARRSGALGAKLTGAGGGGVVLALCAPDTVPRVLLVVRERGFEAFAACLPSTGPAPEVPWCG